MGTQRWCLILSIFLAFVKSEIQDDFTESFYESQFTSPAPRPLSSPTPDTSGLKEVVLFLTPEQVKALQDAGALVRPFPELVNGYPNKQDQYQRNLKIQNTSEIPTVAPKANKKPNPGLDSYYMLLNIQEINDDLALLPQSVEATTKEPTTTPRHKYTKTRSRNKDKENYAASNAKKSNRTKIINQNSNSEYVRFLQNYEKENYLKMAPYRPLPIIPYHTTSNPTKAYIQSNNVFRTNGRNTAHRLATERNLTERPQIISTQTARNEVTKSTPIIKPTSPPLLLHSPVPQRQSKPKEFRETVIPIENLPRQRKKQFQFETSVQAPTTVPRRLNQEQLSLLLAPLYQHQTITEAISQQREESLSEEGKIKTQLPQQKLPQIKNTLKHDDQQFTTEKARLTTKLEKQKTLVEVSTTFRPPPDFIKISRTPSSRTPDLRIPKVQDIKDRVPIEISKPAVSIPTSVLVRSEPFDLPTLYPVTLDITRTVSVQTPQRVGHSPTFDITRGIPVPVPKPFKVDMKNYHVPVPVEQHVSPMTRNFFAEVERPMLVPKASPVTLKLGLPDIVPIQMPYRDTDTLTIIRPIFEH